MQVSQCVQCGMENRQHLVRGEGAGGENMRERVLGSFGDEVERLCAGQNFFSAVHNTKQVRVRELGGGAPALEQGGIVRRGDLDDDVRAVGGVGGEEHI